MDVSIGIDLQAQHLQNEDRPSHQRDLGPDAVRALAWCALHLGGARPLQLHEGQNRGNEVMRLGSLEESKLG